MRVFHLLVITMAAIVVLATMSATHVHAQANIIASFFVDNFYFSPNGDGTQDITTISYNVLDSALVDLRILEKDSSTVVKTLVTATPTLVGQTVYQVPWDGRDNGGTLVTEDTFIVFIRAENATGVDSSFSRVFVDLNRPQAAITNVFPSFFVPNSPDTNAPDIVQLGYSVADPTLSDSVFTFVALFNPSGVRIGDALIDRFVQPPQSFQAVWDGTGATEGVWEVRIELRDLAGNIDQNKAEINVDIDPPSVNGLNGWTIGSAANVNPADTLYGFAWDRNGLADLEMQFFTTGVFEPIPNTTIINDTTFFAIPIADSLSGDGTYEVRVRATDSATRQTEAVFQIRVDMTAPPPPTITSESVVLRTSKYFVEGTGSGPFETITVYRNGALAQIGLTNQNDENFAIDILLLPGKNTIWVTETDNARNESAPSNSVVVEFDVSTGVTIGQPLKPDEPIIVILPEEARLVRLFIYDLAGDMVEELVQTQIATNYVFRWNGLNGDQRDVNRGPLVAVIRVEFVDGRSEMIREVFLWDPN